MIDTEPLEPALDLRDEEALHAEGLLLTFVGVETGAEVEAAALVLQIVDELVNGDVVLGRIGEVGPEVDDIMVLVQAVN